MNYGVSDTVSKKMNIQVRMCSHLQTQNKDIAFQRAMMYLKLKDEGCSKKSALRFASKRVCRSDSTIKYDGPSQFRKLKVNHKEDSLQINGWMNTELQYDMGNRFRNGVKEITREADDVENTLGRDIKALVDHKKLEFHNELMDLNQFIKKEEERTNIVNTPLKELVSKIQSNKEHFGLSMNTKDNNHYEDQINKKQAYNPLHMEVLETNRSTYRQVLRLSNYVNKLSSGNSEASVKNQDNNKLEIKDYGGSNIVNAFLLSKWKNLKGIL